MPGITTGARLAVAGFRKPGLNSVFYTHLDVYKRQLQHTAPHHEPGGEHDRSRRRHRAGYQVVTREAVHSQRSPYRLRSAPGCRPAIPAAAAPVSYTHLDVYKRQGQGAADRLLRPVDVGDPVGDAPQGLGDEFGVPLDRVDLGADLFGGLGGLPGQLLDLCLLYTSRCV